MCREELYKNNQKLVSMFTAGEENREINKG